MRKENLLDNKNSYLCGPIENADDFGFSWRQQLTPILQSRYNINVLNPLLKHKYFKRNGQVKEHEIAELKKQRKFDEYSRIVRREIVHPDLRMVDISDFIIVYLHPAISKCGTIWEMAIAELQRKPILIYEGSEDKVDVDGWLFGVLNHNRFFENVDGIVKYLDKINCGQLTGWDEKRWVL